MYFQVLYDIFNKMCNSSEIEIFDNDLYDLYNNEHNRKNLSSKTLKMIKHKISDDLWLGMMNVLIKEGFFDLQYRVLCPNCSEIIEMYDKNNIISVEDLISSHSYCKDCEDDFEIEEEDISTSYVFTSSLDPQIDDI